MTKAELITMIERAGFEPVERDTAYDQVEKVGLAAKDISAQ